MLGSFWAQGLNRQATPLADLPPVAAAPAAEATNFDTPPGVAPVEDGGGEEETPVKQNPTQQQPNGEGGVEREEAPGVEGIDEGVGEGPQPTQGDRGEQGGGKPFLMLPDPEERDREGWLVD